MSILFQILRSWAAEESSVSSMDEIHAWIEERKANTRVVIEKVPFPEGGFWFFDPKDGFIRNRNNSFFQIAGYRNMIGDRIIYGNKITPLKVVCILASILGVYLLVSGEPMGLSVIGVLAMFAAAISWTIYIVVVKPLYDRYDLLTLLTGLFLSGLIVQTPVVIVTQAATHASLTVTPMGILVTLATAIVCIIIGEFGYIYAVGKLSTTLVAAFENVLPVTAVIFSILIFGKILTATQIVGGLIILLSVTAIAFLERNKE